MSDKWTAKRFIHAAVAAQYHKNDSLEPFYGIQPLLQCVLPLMRRSAPEQSQMALEALAFKAFTFVQYVL